MRVDHRQIVILTCMNLFRCNAKKRSGHWTEWNWIELQLRLRDNMLNGTRAIIIYHYMMIIFINAHFYIRKSFGHNCAFIPQKTIVEFSISKPIFHCRIVHSINSNGNFLYTRTISLFYSCFQFFFSLFFWKFD